MLQINNSNYSRWVAVACCLGAVLLLLVAQARADEQIRIVIFGDSIAAGYGLPLEDAIAPKLHDTLTQEYQLPVTVIADAVPGDTSADARSRVEWMLADKMPDIVIVEFGGNDLLRNLPPEMTFNHLYYVVEKIWTKDVLVLLAGIPPPANLGEAYVAGYEQGYAQILSDYDVAYVPNFLEKIVLIPEMNQPDGRHPNEAGVQQMIANLLPELLKLIELRAEKQ